MYPYPKQSVLAIVFLGAAQLLQVVALDRLVERQLGQRVVYGEPLPFAAHEPGVLPLRQLLGYRHHVHFRPVLVLAILEYKWQMLRNCVIVRTSSAASRGERSEPRNASMVFDLVCKLK